MYYKREMGGRGGRAETKPGMYIHRVKASAYMVNYPATRFS